MRNRDYLYFRERVQEIKESLSHLETTKTTILEIFENIYKMYDKVCEHWELDLEDVKYDYQKLRKMYVLESEKKDKTEYDKGLLRGLYLALQIFENWGEED